MRQSVRAPLEPAPRPAFPLRLLLLAALLVPALAFAVAAWREHVRLHDEAAGSVDRTAAIAQEHALKVIETNTLVLDRIEDSIRGLGWEEIAAREREIHEALQALEAHIEQISALHLIRPDGRLAAISVAYPAPAVDLSERAYFQRHMAGERGLLFGEPIIGRSTGRPSFTMSRARTAPDGRFDGVVLGSVMPAYFERYWTTLVAGADAHFGLVRADGMLLARLPPPPALATRLPPDAALMRAIADGRERGVVVADPALDGGRRLVGFRRVGEHPLYVFHALSLEAVRAAWLRHVALSGALALLAALVLGAATLLAARRWQAEQRALAELARSAAELRAEIARREAAEEELRAAQRLEAVGRLTGGVAHDFNNLLTAILGSLQLLERHLERQMPEAAVPGPGGESQPLLDARTRRLLATARDAVERGSRLTASLLAFSRRQALRAEPLDANALIGAMLPLLRRALGEAVELRLELGAGLPRCMADAAQLEAALLNLVINARDALPPEGGLVTLRTFRALPAARPGEGQIGIAVSDTGAGMSPEARARAFEPFFTTKPVGKGTGLGLSQVYGVVRQLGGDVTIDSAPGQGTTVLLRLPEADAADAPAVPDPPAAPTPAGASAEGLAAPGMRSVLVVEDDPAVREMAAETFREAGWQVREAPDGRAALALLEGGAALDLLFTDVVMPGGLSGVELAEAARRLRPALAVLLASGYVGEATAREEDAGAAAFPLLGKPYDRAALLAAAAAVFGTQAAAPAAGAASARADAAA
ncbi:hybrid sensor histidine kinase/response regulator [Caldovatus aquaticus]|uniref:histidine kinase n=1 Tax=Caldovatus aquaticus TaxID=2865671 RepID=A0ABS7F5N1_9PROT|nr:hybrid sensor histidine kinase/response regulator [Caldovatus aquaticus]MBW8270869.1 response regulator [Caldovatus aquaticus]